MPDTLIVRSRRNRDDRVGKAHGRRHARMADRAVDGLIRQGSLTAFFRVASAREVNHLPHTASHLPGFVGTMFRHAADTVVITYRCLGW